jgi:hypothetical protein
MWNAHNSTLPVPIEVLQCDDYIEATTLLSSVKIPGKDKQIFKAEYTDTRRYFSLHFQSTPVWPTNMPQLKTPSLTYEQLQACFVAFRVYFLNSARTRQETGLIQRKSKSRATLDLVCEPFWVYINPLTSQTSSPLSRPINGSCPTHKTSCLGAAHFITFMSRVSAKLGQEPAYDKSLRTCTG